jgi:hypothetical protein
MTLTVDYLKSLRLCWTDEALDEAALSWPDAPTWAWFLGDRLHAMQRGAVLERLSVAHAYATRKRVAFIGEAWTRPRRLGDQFKAAKTYTDAELWLYLGEFGALLDASDAAEEAAKVAAAAAKAAATS